jgi:hypothetical protein
MVGTGESPGDIMRRRALEQVNDPDRLGAVVEEGGPGQPPRAGTGGGPGKHGDGDCRLLRTELDAQLAAAGPTQPSTCSTERCFEDAFGTCERATRFITPQVLGARARYDILGVVEGGCRISLTYVSNPNPDWVDKPLLLTLDPARRFADQIMAGRSRIC